MTALDVDDRGSRGRAWARRALAAARASLAAALAVFVLQPAGAAAADVVRIAVFDFELDDKSASGGTGGPDAIDLENLAKSTAEARRLLTESGRYDIVDTAGVAADVAAAGGAQFCDGCDAALAKTLGADRSMVGVFTRVSRTEYTLQVVVRDTGSGEVVSNSFTGLRMGANDAWPRGVKWLMQNQVLKAGEGVE